MGGHSFPTHSSNLTGQDQQSCFSVSRDQPAQLCTARAHSHTLSLLSPTVQCSVFPLDVFFGCSSPMKKLRGFSFFLLRKKKKKQPRMSRDRARTFLAVRLVRISDLGSAGLRGIYVCIVCVYVCVLFRGCLGHYFPPL